MQQSPLILVWKIAILTVLLVSVFQAYSYIVEEDNLSIETQSSLNKDSFLSAKWEHLGTTSVAITTAVGRRSVSSGVPDSSTLFYGSVEKVGSSETERNAERKKMIETNMQVISEYLGLVKTDILATLSSSTSRKDSLNSIITQLELRYRNAAISSKNLSDYQEKLVTNIEVVQNQIDTIKEKMNSDFALFDAKASYEDVETYLKLRQEYQSNYVDITYINMFLRQYSFLTDYNKKLLDTLLNNKEALINQSFVVIPSSGDEFLRVFNLVYDEAEYKAGQTKTETEEK